MPLRLRNLAIFLYLVDPLQCTYVKKKKRSRKILLNTLTRSAVVGFIYLDVEMDLRTFDAALTLATCYLYYYKQVGEYFFIFVTKYQLQLCKCVLVRRDRLLTEMRYKKASNLRETPFAIASRYGLWKYVGKCVIWSNYRIPMISLSNVFDIIRLFVSSYAAAWPHPFVTSPSLRNFFFFSTCLFIRQVEVRTAYRIIRGDS